MTDQTLEKVVSAPAAVLGKTLDTSKQVAGTITNQRHVKKATGYWQLLGPGLTTGGADDDPSGIATYSQQGAQYGFQLLWLAPFTFPLMATVQEMCARIGIVTGRGLAANIRHYYPRWVLYLCTVFLVIANTLNLGADLGAMAKAVQLLNPHLDFGFIVLAFTIFTLALQIFVPYKRYAKYLKLLAIFLLSYVASTLSISHLDWKAILHHTFIPSLSFSKTEIVLVTAILGTTISPYLFFWQTSQEVENEILAGKTTLQARQEITTNKDIKNMRLDVWIGMIVSNLVMFFIIISCAATLFTHGITNINTASDAAQALRPIAGDKTYLLFALGIIGSGLLAVPILAGSASYALSESFGWKTGLHKKLGQANSFYGVIMISTLVGLGINFIGFDPIKALIYSAVVNGLIAPLILVLIVLMSSNEKIMGKRVNHPVITSIGWFVTIVMIVTAITTIATFFIS